MQIWKEEVCVCVCEARRDQQEWPRPPSQPTQQYPSYLVHLHTLTYTLAPVHQQQHQLYTHTHSLSHTHLHSRVPRLSPNSTSTLALVGEWVEGPRGKRVESKEDGKPALPPPAARRYRACLSHLPPPSACILGSVGVRPEWRKRKGVEGEKGPSTHV